MASMQIAHLGARALLFIALGGFAVFYVAILVAGLRRPSRADESTDAPAGMPSLLATGFVTNFFDTLGIGSFATTTTIFRHWKLVRDEDIPGTLNIGHTLPTIVQAYIYTSIVPVDSRTLILMIVAAVLGAWLGAGVVAGWPRRRVQIGMGVTLPILAFAMLLAASQLGALPGGGTLLGLAGYRLAIAVTTNFVLGALMTIGLGLYAPCMILVSLCGMNPTTAFPIMMGSCAFLMPIASARFVRARCFDRRATIGLFAGGIPAVLIAAFIVKTLPLSAVRWLVVVVVLYTAANLLLTAYRERGGAAIPGGPKPEVA
jgi:uncharacterized membrane protein YfcA